MQSYRPKSLLEEAKSNRTCDFVSNITFRLFLAPNNLKRVLARARFGIVIQRQNNLSALRENTIVVLLNYLKMSSFDIITSSLIKFSNKKQIIVLCSPNHLVFKFAAVCLWRWEAVIRAKLSKSCKNTANKKTSGIQN